MAVAKEPIYFRDKQKNERAVVNGSLSFEMRRQLSKEVEFMISSRWF